MDGGDQRLVELGRNHSLLSEPMSRHFSETQHQAIQPTSIGRRTLLQRTGFGLGAFALTDLFQADHSPAVANERRHLHSPHFAPVAKNVIYIHMVGAPSHLDLFDHKPVLQQREGQDCPQELFESGKFAFVRKLPKLLGTAQEKKYQFRRCGESGLMLSNLLPHLQQVADEMCVVKSLHTDEFNHGPAQMFMLSGFGRFGRPVSGRGSVMDWVVKIRICPRLSCWSPVTC